MVSFHLPSISLIKKVNGPLPRVIIGTEKTAWKSFGFSAEECAYIDKKKKDKAELIKIQQLDEFVCLILASQKGEPWQQKEKMRKHGFSLSQILKQSKHQEVILTGGEPEHLLALAEGLCLSAYQFNKYKSEQKTDDYLKQIHVLHEEVGAPEIKTLNTSCEATALARTLVNEPQNFLTAIELSAQFQDMGKKAGFAVEVFNESKIKSLKMGGLLAVNQGSQNPPTFTVMEYKPARPKNKKPLVLIGKGVVYDTGGLSLKPTPNSMDSMKCDMAGAAVVGCVMYAIAVLKLPYHVVALVPATDNRPGENAYAPGDVITMMNGKTVEMLNADAEGRMILADALHYAERYQPGLVIDLATLTGAAAAAIGHFGIVAMGTASEPVKAALKSSGQNVYERLVEFPFWDEYADLLRSDIADMKNIGGPIAGAITAGKFLEHFTQSPWMHFDIAGPAFISSQDHYRGKNGTGSGVRLLIDFIRTGNWS